MLRRSIENSVLPALAYTLRYRLPARPAVARQAQIQNAGCPGFCGDHGSDSLQLLQGRRLGLKGAPGRGTLEKEKPPVLEIIQRSRDVAIFMLPDVQRMTIEPILRSVIAPGSLVNTDEYIIYGKLTEWGYEHKTFCHANGEDARDEGGDGFSEVPVNTIEGFWSLLRSWLRPHRGVSQENLRYYPGFFEFIHNVRRRGKALLSSLLATLFGPAA